MPYRERRRKEKSNAARDAESIQALIRQPLASVFRDPKFMDNSDITDGLPSYLKCRAIKFDEEGNPYLPHTWGKTGGLGTKEKWNEIREEIRLLAGPKWGKVHLIPDIIEIIEPHGLSVAPETLRRWFKGKKS